MIKKDTREALQAINQSFKKPIISDETWDKVVEAGRQKKAWDEEFKIRQQEKQKIPDKFGHIEADQGAFKALLDPLKESMAEGLREAQITCELISRREVLDSKHADMRQMLDYENKMMEFNNFILDRAREEHDEGRIAWALAEIEKTKENMAFYEKQIAEGE